MKHLLSLTLCLCAHSLNAASLGKTTSQTLNSLFNNYDSRIKPDGVVNVSITAYIIKMHGFSESDSEFNIDIYFRQRWVDPRLTFSQPQRINGNEELLDKIWVPDTFFPGSTKGYKGKLTKPNTFVRFEGNGTVFISHLMTLTVPCPHNGKITLRDSRHCSLETESYGFSMEDIAYHWGKGDKSVGYDAEAVFLKGFKLQNLNFTSEEIKLSSGTYSRVKINFDIERAQSCAFFWRHFLPALLVTLTSFAPHFLLKKSKSRLVVSALILVAFILVSGFSKMTLTNSHSATPYDKYFVINFVAVATNFAVVMLVAVMTDSRDHMDSDSKMMIMSKHTKCVHCLLRFARIVMPTLYALSIVCFGFKHL